MITKVHVCKNLRIRVVMPDYLLFYRQYSFDPDPDILSLFSNFDFHCSDEVWFTLNVVIHVCYVFMPLLTVVQYTCSQFLLQ